MPSVVSGQKGRYVLETEIGSGATGVVYRAHDERTSEPFALKVLRLPLPDTETRRRFEQEARLGQNFTHESLCRVHDVGSHQGHSFLVMDLIEGTSLDRMVARHTLSRRDGVAIVARIARALDTAHKVGIVHRDVKPANVIVDRNGRPVLTDFGFAKDLWSKLQVTTDASILGTPAFMAPEQASGKPVTPSVDVYALGVVLYFVLTGEVPFNSTSASETLHLVVSAPPLSPRHFAPDLEPELEAIIMRCLAKRPVDRFASAFELANALEAFLGGGAPRESSGGVSLAKLIPLGVLTVALAFATAQFLVRRPSKSSPPRPTPQASASSVASPARPGATSLAKARELANAGAGPERVQAELERCLALEPDDAEALLELASVELSTGRLDRARVHMERASARASDPAARELRDALGKRLAQELEAEDAVVRTATEALRDFRTVEALAALEDAAKKRPQSARLQKNLALALSIAGHGAEALEREREARRLDDTLVAFFDEDENETLRTSGLPQERHEDLAAVPPVWSPLFGGLWGTRQGELCGVGRGTGPFHLAALMRTDAPAAKRYKVSVEVSLESGDPGAYAGIIFGAKRPEDLYLAYVFHDREYFARASEPGAAEEFEKKHGVFPKMIRLARLVGGRWQMRDQQIVIFPDKGFVNLSLEVTGERTVKITVGGEPCAFTLDAPLDGRVGLLKFYDTVVRFRSWEWAPLPE